MVYPHEEILPPMNHRNTRHLRNMMLKDNKARDTRKLKQSCSYTNLERTGDGAGKRSVVVGNQKSELGGVRHMGLGAGADEIFGAFAVVTAA